MKISRCKKLAVSGKHTFDNLIYFAFAYDSWQGTSTGKKSGENPAKMTSGNMACDSVCLTAYTGLEGKHFKRKKVIVAEVDTQICWMCNSFPNATSC